MSINLASCLLKDFVYKQDDKTHYVFADDKFVLVDRDEVADSILKNIDTIFELHYRKLSRSALEFFLNHYLSPKK